MITRIEHEFRLKRAVQIANLCRRKRWTHEDVMDMSAEDLLSLQRLAIPGDKSTMISNETISMVIGMLEARPPFLLTAEEMREQDAAFDAHLLGRQV